MHASTLTGDPSREGRPLLSVRADIALAFALYALLAYAAIHVARQPGTIATVWLANGAAIALIVTAPRSRTPALLTACAAGNLAANLAYGDALGLSAAFVLPNTLEVALGVALVRRSGPSARFSIEHGALLQVLAAGALLPPLLGATVGAATLQGLGFAAFSRVWADWYIGAALGAAAMLPLVLALRSERPAQDPARPLPLFNRSLLPLLAAVGAATLLSLHWLPYPFVVIGMALMLLAFTRGRLATLASAAVVVGALALAVALRWFVPTAADSPFGHAVLYLSALLAIVPAQLVSVAMARQRALTRMLSAVGSRVDNIVVFADMKGVYRWANQAREVYWGTPNAQAIGRTFAHNLGEPGYSESFEPLLEQALAGGTARRIAEIEFAARGRRTMEMLVQPARDDEGHQIGVLYSGTDITELEASRRELQQVADQLRASHERLEQFVRIVSHDLREPLNTIAQFSDLIAATQHDRLDKAGRLYFGHMRQGAARMRQMLDDVLAFVRLDEGPAAQPETVALDDLLAEVLAGMHARIQGAAARVTRGELGFMRGHRVLLSLVLQNLLTNAIKFVPGDRPPAVHVSVVRNDSALRLTVSDNGIGIEPGRVSELGQPFRRLHARRKFDGTGLGLAICNRIAELHGGRIEIESVLGEGSRFSLVIPLAD